jgi:DNA-binding NarL/FixJ family response regulator
MTEPRVRVLIVDDHGVVRHGLRELIATNEDFDVVGEAGNGEEAIRMVALLNPDIVLMDISMPVMDGVAATRQITALHPQTQVIMLTSDSGQKRILGALEAGATAYILKDSEPDQLMRRLRSAAETRASTRPG